MKKDYRLLIAAGAAMPFLVHAAGLACIALFFASPPEKTLSRANHPYPFNVSGLATASAVSAGLGAITFAVVLAFQLLIRKYRPMAPRRPWFMAIGTVGGAMGGLMIAPPNYSAEVALVLGGAALGIVLGLIADQCGRRPLK
jgi:hypothetical protein